MAIHTQLRPPAPLTRALGIAALALALPLAACETAPQPSEPSSSAPSESSDTASPTDDAGATLDPTGKWTSPETGDPFLEFTDDGNVTGSDGCNRIETTWTAGKDKVTIDSFTTTQKACPGDQWLSKASSATIDGNVMKVMDGQGKVIGGLEKEDK